MTSASVSKPPSSGTGAVNPGWLARVSVRALERLHRWAESGWGGPAVGSWGFLQSSVVPGPTDAVLVPLGLSDPKLVYRLAAWAVAGTLAGGILAYLIGAHAFDELGVNALELFGVSEAMVASREQTIARHGWALVALSTISPLSAKMVCIAAGAFGVPFWQFGLALLGGRLVRFMVVASLLRYAGPVLLARLSKSVGRPVAAS